MAPPASAKPSKISGLDNLKDSRYVANIVYLYLYHLPTSQAGQGDGHNHRGAPVAGNPRPSPSQVGLNVLTV